MTTKTTITLQSPIKRGETEILQLEIVKPNASALRGASLRGLLDLQTTDILTVLPRVTMPALTPMETSLIDPADLVQIGAELAGFLLPNYIKELVDQVPDSPTA